MSDFRPTEEIQTLVFFDLETTGLFDGPLNSDPTVPPRSIPGDFNRDVSKIFKTYADNFDTGIEYSLPRITEISFVCVPRQVYKDGMSRMHKKHLDSVQGELKIPIATRIFVQQINPELSEQEWTSYEQKQCSVSAFRLCRSVLNCQPTFAESWPLIHSFLSSLSGPIALIGHNVLRFDCRVLLGELRRVKMLEKYPIPSSVYFADSYLAFLDLEKRFHEEISTIMDIINWKKITQTVIEKKLVETNRQKITAKRRILFIEEKEDRQSNNVTSTDSDVILCDEEISNQEAVILQAPPNINIKDSPLRNNNLPNEGWKTAPAKLVGNQLTPADYAEANPLNFMNIENWSPAKRRRLRNEFFERKNDGNWVFCVPLATQYFHTRGNFRLVRLYTDIIRGLYCEHQAFDDCVALLQVCLSYGEDFLTYVDSYSSQLKPLST